MTEIGEQGSSGEGRDRTVVWIVLGMAVLCVVAVGVAVVGLGALALFGVTSQTIALQPTPPPVAYPTLPPPMTPTATGGAASQWPARETFDIADQGRQHIPDGAPVSYNSDPPTSGPHYATWLDPGFYTDYAPDGYVVHNLEHGYVVIWYDCTSLSATACLTLQNKIEGLMKDSDESKLIGMPRSGMPHLIALTAWTKLAFLDEFDADFIDQFIADNAGNAPEPSAP